MLEKDSLNDNINEVEYAVRGPIVSRALELSKQGKEITYCNIGNPHFFGQKYITHFRQILSICESPELLNNNISIFSKDIIAVSKKIIENLNGGTGSYSESNGYYFIRKAISEFINKRDGFFNSDPDSIFITDGATQGIQFVLNLLLGKNEGILTPIPQYPLYSASIKMLGGRPIGYFLDENENWNISLKKVEESYQKAIDSGIKIKALVVINPGNPTGSLLSEDTILSIVSFAKSKNIPIIADEVYQHNIFKNNMFTSFSKVINKYNFDDVSLFSFHSTSKGFLGECGHRGGYFEVKNVSKDVMNAINKIKTINLCPNIVGQIMTYLMVSDDSLFTDSMSDYKIQKSKILDNIEKRAAIIYDLLKDKKFIKLNQISAGVDHGGFEK